jgi:hypothetical protein
MLGKLGIIMDFYITKTKQVIHYSKQSIDSEEE